MFGINFSFEGMMSVVYKQFGWGIGYRNVSFRGGVIIQAIVKHSNHDEPWGGGESHTAKSFEQIKIPW